MGAPHPAADIFAAAKSHLNRRVAGMNRLIGANAYAVSADGAVVRLSDGREFLDLGTWAPTVLGHRPPAVVAAVHEQLGTLPVAPRGLASAAAPLLARRLAELASPSRLERVWLGANGADVVEAALKLARVATGRLRVLALRGGFHGRTLGALAVSDGDRYSPGLTPLLREVTFCDPVPGAVEREVGRGDVAAVILEVLQGSSPAIPLPGEMLAQWARAAHEAGALVIVDEIQTGLWRCGEFSLGLSGGLDPDAVLFGKTLGGGVMPLSALLCTADMAAALERTPFLHSQTFSGHPLACAAGLAALAASREAVAAHGERVAAWLASLRIRLAGRADVVTEAGACGLMLGARFVSAQAAEQFVMAAARRGVLVAPSDSDRSVVRVLPSLVLADKQMAEAAQALEHACGEPRPWGTGTAKPVAPGPASPQLPGREPRDPARPGPAPAAVPGAARSPAALPLPSLLTPEQRRHWHAVADFGLQELGADVAARDAAAEFSLAGWGSCAGYGLLSLPVPAEHGGQGAGYLPTVLAFDALGYACRDNGLLFSLAAHLWAATLTISRFGTSEQRQHYLPRLCGGSLIAGHAMTEPGSGSDAFAMRTTAERSDGGWLLNGEKTFITNAPVAGLFVAFAASRERPGPYGLSCFLVDVGAVGLTTGPPIAKLGLRTSPMAGVVFHDCWVPESALLGKPGMGMAIFSEAIHLERATILASTLGTMQRQIERGAAALRMDGAAAHGEVPHRLARMAARLHTSRLLTYRLAGEMDTGRTGAHESALVKIKLSEAFLRNSQDAWRNDLALGDPLGESGREVRDALAGRIYSGTNEIQRTLVAHGLGLS